MAGPTDTEMLARMITDVCDASMAQLRYRTFVDAAKVIDILLDIRRACAITVAVSSEPVKIGGGNT